MTEYKIIDVDKNNSWFKLDSTPKEKCSLLSGYSKGEYRICSIEEDKVYFRLYDSTGQVDFDTKPLVGEKLYHHNIFSESLVGQGIIGFEPIGACYEVKNKNYLWTEDMENNIGKYGCILVEEDKRVLIKFEDKQYWYPKTFEIFFYLIKNNNRPKINKKHKIINVGEYGGVLFEDRNIYKGDRLIHLDSIIEIKYVYQEDYGSNCSIKFLTEDIVELTEGQEWKKLNI